MTTTEAARVLGCTRHHVALLIRRGHVLATKPGHDYVVDINSVYHYSRSRAKPGRKAKAK